MRGRHRTARGVIASVAIVAATALGLGLAGTGLSPAAGAATTSTADEQIAANGYVYGYAPVVAARTRGDMLCLTAPNTLINQSSLSTPATRSVVAPNVDTLYSIGWLDLRTGPVVLSVPDMGDRYYVFELLDIYTNVSADIGTRLNGQRAGRYAIVPPGWQGGLPSDVVAVSSPTWDVWMIGRTLVKGSDDLDAARAVQGQYSLSVLPDSAPTAAPPRLPAVSCTDQPDPTTPYDAGAAFFDELAAVLAADPPPSVDQPLLDDLATLGVTPGSKPSTGDPATVEALANGVSLGEQQVQEAVPNAFAQAGEWGSSLNAGTYGTDYLSRAAIAVAALGANVPAESIYYLAGAARGQSFVGTTTYTMHFPADALPPAGEAGFWSLTMYNEDQYLVPNPLRRYSLGDRSDLVYNPDGSLDLQLSATRPNGPVANWLPAPEGPFNLIVRVYLPTGAATDGGWSPPAVTTQSDAG
ncbi:DUF1254 domain-containing protein [Frankia sp. AgKG'84/4]|uniref:DUF1254 domain-containing protein n=1 Tax=Frankia sp. AgKG'84/4 TaxID=573490 RepID=UPI00200DD67D|nr:DUF1254 domain-containing protein [Frankia sp. AgKG'84/4]MCL9793647.1 DUF1254 domain-containing protein [Frankia sp. AgKG'84/4]